ncbi:putative phage abortive infection protein [Leptospira vanthielii]|uniref:Phage abortive infection protein n=1 Tax=Leptospira vanthielii serovar Holland str. Waz Holland = ATCC 700522 TaxID=1218591 RepID=N1W4M1_9LEPT|nr:putative phage abortive infection protein [Leptospira vanthielii]EMY71199.1 hypothetical protein LEP1GSC199_1573 [Leptospira vanthielii serovar Holland str. Waz Holland = ATCC 700522]
MIKKQTILYLLSITSFVLGFIFLASLLIQLRSIGFHYSPFQINLDESNKIASIIQGITGTIWLFTTISLLFLTTDIQKREFKNTSEALNRQNQDSHFFNLINTFLHIRSNVEFSLNQPITNETGRIHDLIQNQYKGSKYFQYAFHWYQMYYEYIDPRNNNIDRKKKHRDTLKEIFKIPDSLFDKFIEGGILSENEKIFTNFTFTTFYPLISSELDNYLNFLTEIITFSIESIDNKLFISHIKSILSPYEFTLLFYYSLSNENLMKKLKEISFFKHINTSFLIKEEHKQFYTD